MSFTDGENPVGAGQDDPFEGLSDFGRQFLEREVQDPEMRTAMAPHVKAWDQGANSQFQKIHEQYKPWRDLGDVNNVKQQLNFVQRFNADPEGTLRLLVEHQILTPAQLQNLLGSSAPPAQPSGPGSSGQDDVDAKIQAILDARLGKTEQTVGALAHTLSQQQQEAQDRHAMAQLDQAVQGMKTKYGNDFHEDLVLAMAAQASIDLEAAHKIVSETINGVLQSRIPPRAGFTMPGNGGAATFNKKASDLTDETERRNYIAQRLMQMNAGNH